jgi:A/G-specific adenine glycosylase
MLQQTTVAAVVPYYERFIENFPTLEALAKAPEEKVLSLWAGLGYYSRARRLKAAALEIQKLGGFPKTYKDLIKLPGFGPYTARAVAALAFGEKVGVLDGNANRVFTRLLGYKGPWWSTEFQKKLQQLSDNLALHADPNLYNQALMELGATVCTVKKPLCSSCPVAKSCEALRQGSAPLIPQPKPRPEKQIWIWRPDIVVKRKRLGVVVNNYAPFLKGQLLPPGEARPVKKAPAQFAYKHNITCYHIYVQLSEGSSPKAEPTEWVNLEEISHKIPSSLLKKALVHHKVIEPQS